jgi:hypothetical protein
MALWTFRRGIGRLWLLVRLLSYLRSQKKQSLINWLLMHWNIENGTKTSYFRGRKLYGRATKVPKGYKGVVLVGSQEILENKKENGVDQSRGPDREENIEEEDDDEEEEEVKIMEEVGEFDEVLVWGHEAIVDNDDTYVRSLEEWIRVAESVSLREMLYVLQRATANILRSTRSKGMELVVRGWTER